jgi:hypothetical protein
MKKLLIAFLLIASTSFATSPAGESYGDIVEWVQGMEATFSSDISSLQGASDYSGILNITTASATAYIPFSGVYYIPILGSGTMSFDAMVNAVATDGSAVGSWHFIGAVSAITANTGLVSLPLTYSTKSGSPDVMVASVSADASGNLQIIASSPANVHWKANVKVKRNTL